MLAAPVIPHNLNVWLLGMVVGLLIVGHNLLIFKASNYLEVSLVGALTKLRLAWVFILGMVFLGAAFSWTQLAGTVLAILAGVVIIHYFRKPESLTGVSLVLTATIFNASIIILTKYLLGSFNAASLTFFVSFLPAAILNFVLMPHARARIKKLFKDDWRIVLLACTLGSLANLALNKALSLHDANSVIIISEVFLVVTLAGEHIILKEKESLWIKLASVALAISGAVLILWHF
jgi:drug/metabolite transporter (DMT)-like permease